MLTYWSSSRKPSSLYVGPPSPPAPEALPAAPFLALPRPPAESTSSETSTCDLWLELLTDNTTQHNGNGTRTPSTIDRQRARESPDLLYALVSAVLTLASNGSKASSV